MALVFNGGSLLFRNGQLAFGTACCCNVCCQDLPDVISATYSNTCGFTSFTFNAKDGSGNPISQCQIPFSCPEGTQMAVAKCWYSGDVTITCGETSPTIGVGGAGLCNSSRTGQFFLVCASPCLTDTEERFYLFYQNFCKPLEQTSVCLEPVDCLPQRVNCAAVKTAGGGIFISNVGFPCVSCMPEAEGCGCVDLEFVL